MRPTIYTVETDGPGVLSTMAKPRGGDWLDDEMTGPADLGVNALVCLLTDAELTDLDLEGEGSAAQQAGLTFLQLPIADRGLPERDAFRPVVATLVTARRRNEHVVVHCRFGIGRSSLLAAAVLGAEGVVPNRPGTGSVTPAAGRCPTPLSNERSLLPRRPERPPRCRSSLRWDPPCWLGVDEPTREGRPSRPLSRPSGLVRSCG